MKKHKLLLLPGWSMDSSVWKPVIPFLSNYFNLVYCDWNGIEHAEGYITKVQSLVDKEKGNLCLMGWSLGSILAIDAAYKNQDRIDRIILVSGTSRFIRDKKTKYMCGWPESTLERMKASLDNDNARTVSLFHSSIFNTEEMANAKYEDFIKTIDAGNKKSNKELQAGLDLLLQTDLRHLLPDIEVPILLIHGEKDTICPVCASEYIAGHAKGKSVLNIIAGAGHAPFITAADEFEKTIKAFIQQGENDD